MRFFRLSLFAAACLAAFGQSPCDVRHLTIFDANVAEFREERSFDLQPGLNKIEWRSLMPQAIVRTLRVTGDQATIVRQNITYDGPEVRGQKRPALHLVVRNDGAAGVRKLQIDYLAPGLSWKGDYSLLLAAVSSGAPPREMVVDGWVTVQNDTSADVCAGTVDLVAGDVQLQYGAASGARQFQANSQMASQASAFANSGEGPDISGVSVFSRLRMGTDVSMDANALINRFPVLQRAKFPVEQRNIFENDHQTQTLGRGGFMLQPRGLEVRLVGRNGGSAPLPAGTVTVYSQESGVPQVVGQDRIPLTPPGADFSVTQGRSNVLQGTRRIVDRQIIPDPTVQRRRERVVTRVEVVIANRGGVASPAFVREGVEAFGNGEWSVPQSSHQHQKLGNRMMEFRLDVPAKGEVKLEYTVEIR